MSERKKRWWLQEFNRDNFPVVISAFIDAIFIMPIVCTFALMEFWNSTTVLLFYPTPDLTGKPFQEIIYILFMTGDSNIFDEIYTALCVSWIYSFFSLHWMIRQRKSGLILPRLPRDFRWFWKGAFILTLAFVGLFLLVVMVADQIEVYYTLNQLDTAFTTAQALFMVAVGSIIVQYLFSLVVVHASFIIGASYINELHKSMVTDE